MLTLQTPPPLSVYVHIPWCLRKCPYCDFNSHAQREPLPEREYVAALLADLEQELPGIWGRELESVFIGGGTPSLFSAEAIDRLLSGLRALLPLTPLTEVTLEANPGTFEQERFAEYRHAGINRLSLGVQSFEDARLQALGRVHDAKEARNAVEQARLVGFDNLNIDLMYALPGQDPSGALRDLETAIGLGPTHVSYYQLTIEPNTLFATAPPRLPEHDLAWRMQTRAQERLHEAGYEQYEVSAYATPGHRCRHNLNYWRFGDYVGIGAGAHGKLTRPDLGKILRRAKHRRPADYLAGAGGPQRLDSERSLSRQDLALEFMLNALRLTEGFEPGLFLAHTGLAITAVEPGLREAERRGLLEWTPLLIRPTELGRRFLDDLVGLFLAETADRVPA